MNEAGIFLGISTTSIGNAIKKGSIIKESFLVTDDENYFVGDKTNLVKTSITVLNTLTNEILKFKTQSDAAKYLNVSRSAISMIIKSRNKIKDIYLVSNNESSGEEIKRRTRSKFLHVLNTQTNKSEYFSNQKEVAKFLDISSSAVTQAIQGEYLIKGIFLVVKKTNNG
jgi:predicted transcriptional regulator